MSSDKTATAREILRRNITAVNNRDMNAYLANQHPDVEFVLPGGTTLRGREEVRASTQAFWDAFPDGRLEFGAQVLAEDSAAAEVIFSGTHTGPMPTPQRRTPSNRQNDPHHFDIDADLRRRHGHLRACLQRPARVAHPARARREPIVVYGPVTPPSSGG